MHPISDLQIEYSLVSRGPEARILPLLSELGIGVTAYGVLSRGLLSGSKPKSARDLRAHLPRFSGENLQRNEHLVGALRQLAGEKDATASQLAIAWVMAKGANIVPLIGARTPTQLAESLGALRITLTLEHGREVLAGLRAVLGEAAPQAVEEFDGESFWIGRRFQHLPWTEGRRVLSRDRGERGSLADDLTTARRMFVATKPHTIDEYLAGLSPENRAALQKVRQAVHASAPGAEECISIRFQARAGLPGTLVRKLVKTRIAEG